MSALFAGALDKQSEAALLGHVETCAACRAEREWFKTLTGDLETLGDTLAGNAPQVDLVNAVMRAVERNQETRAGVVPFKPRPQPRRSRTFAWLGLATAAAAVVLILWVSGYRITPPTEPAPAPIQAKAPVPEEQPGSPARQGTQVAANKEIGPSKAKYEEAKRLLPGDLYMRPPENVSKKGSDTGDLKDLTANEVLELRKRAVADPEARAQLAEWATLTEKKAREMLQDAGVSREAKIGAGQALPPGEALPLLLAAVQASPNDPYLRSELAKAYAAQPGGAGKAAEQLMHLSALDPNNALIQYRLASNLFSQGDIQGATAALQRAASLDEADTYAREAEAYREQALAASGVRPDTARTLTALTTGTSQYSDLIALGNQLLQFGKESEQQGDLNLAQQVYEAVQGLGATLSGSSTLSTERLAGLDIQSSAIDLLSRIFSLQGLGQEMNALAQQTQGLVSAYDAIAEFFDQINALFSGNISQNVLKFIVDFILQNGDVNLLDYFPASSHS